MKRLLPILLSAALVFGAVPVAVGGSPPSARGNGVIPSNTGGEITNAFTVKQFPDGTVRGQFDTFRAGISEYHATLDCLQIVGNRAYMSGVLTESSNPEVPGRAIGDPIEFWVEDNGEGKNAEPDLVSFLGFGFREDCTAEDWPPEFVREVVAGNVQVTP